MQRAILGSRRLFVFLCGNDVLSRFLYHVLLNQQTVIHSKVRKASIPRLGRNIVENIKIPVPPLEVQAEIVRILDKFTELTTELTTELANRKKQYEYYKDKLLCFSLEIPRKKIGEICQVKSGGTPSKSVEEYWDRGTIKWLGSSVCQNSKRINNVTNYITEEGLNHSSAKKISC